MIGDVLFSQIEDCTRITIPEYGTPHPDTGKWPNHKLVFVRPVENERDGIFEFFYAADRDNQNLYNWEVTKADIGGTRFDAVARDYLVPRASFVTTTPTMGTAMPNVPTGKFTGTFVLAERSQKRIGQQELDSLYVVDSHVYIDKQPLVDIEINRETGTAQQITTNYYYRGESVGGSTIETLVANPSNSYWNLNSSGFGNVAKQLSDDWWEVTQRQWINLADIWEWEIDRRGPLKFFCPSDETTTTVTSANNTPGPLSPLPTVPVGTSVKIVKWGKYMRTTTTTRASATPQVLDELNYLADDGYAYPVQQELVENTDVPDERVGVDEDGRVDEYQGIEGCLSVKSNVQALSLEDETRKRNDRLPPDKFFVGGAQRNTVIETIIGNTPPNGGAGPSEAVEVTHKGNIGKVSTTTLNGASPVPLPYTSFDQRTGIGYVETQELVPISDVVQTEVGEDGVADVYETVDADFAVKTSRRLVSPEEREWVDIVNYEWPPVLQSIELRAFGRRNGSSLVVPVIRIRQGFAGPQQANVRQYWQKDPVTPTPPPSMIPEGFIQQTPYYTLNVPPCLHPEVTLSVTSGTEDPVWVYFGVSDVFPATNYVDWPESVTWLESKPYQGGYLVTEWTVERPAIPTP